jgi:hypothetical protein
MPRYDFRCEAGHVGEHMVSRGTYEVPCACGLAAQREVVPSRVGVTGVTVPPMRERKLPISRFQEAHGTLLHESAKAGVEPPDTWSAAKRAAAAIKTHRPDVLGDE